MIRAPSAFVVSLLCKVAGVSLEGSQALIWAYAAVAILTMALQEEMQNAYLSTWADPLLMCYPYLLPVSVPFFES